MPYTVIIVVLNNNVKKRVRNIMTLEEAKNRILQLEHEIAVLKAENEELRGRSLAGRKKHDEKWMASYNDFVIKYEGGMTIMEIVEEGAISRRTAYRYLKYYRNMTHNNLL
ncbi:MAG: helix-turn-helix domain-containing protein [Lachnospiraceae bacterium]|nr:helix-turn-helix domain-containing protein [Lachnospiraceae bacterium]